MDFLYDRIFKTTSTATPITWGVDGSTNRLIVQRIEEMVKWFGERGFNIEIGSEQEFVLENLRGKYTKTDDGVWIPLADKKEFIEAKRAWAIETHLAQVPPQFTNSPETLAQLQQIREFTPPELLIFELLYRSQDKLEYKFGTQLDGEGYYDVHKVMEVNVIKADPLTGLRNAREFLYDLNELAHEYGLGIAFHTRHLSVSIHHKERGSLFDFAGREPTEETQAIISGIVRCAYDALPCLAKRYALEQTLPGSEMRIGPERVNPLKIRPGTDGNGVVELRLNDNPVARGHLAIAVLTMLSGMRYGIESRDRFEQDAVQEVVVVNRNSFRADNKQMFFLREILSAAEIEEDGQVIMTPTNMQQIAKYIKYLPNEIGYSGPSLNVATGVTRMAKLIANGIRIIEGKVEAVPGTNFDTDELKEKLAKIRLQKVITVESPYLSGRNYSIGRPEEQIDRMENSRILGEMWGEEIKQEAVRAHRLNLLQGSPDSVPLQKS